MKPNSDRSEDVLKLRALHKLLGAVPSSLRAVSVEQRKTEIAFLCYFSTDAPDEDIELLSCAAAELISDYPAPFTLDERYVRQPKDVPMKHLKHLIFHRYEIGY